MRITVTGGAGAIGRYVVAHLQEQGVEVCVLDVTAWSPSDAGTGEPETVVVAAANDRNAVDRALRGSDAVIHLAGIPSPMNEDPVTVFTNNTDATMTVLTAAAEQGITAAVIASSICVLGLVYAPLTFSPQYVPLDEDHPLVPKDAYALAKQCDEATAAMTSRRCGMNVLAYRFPYTTPQKARRERMQLVAADATEASRELWAYLDVHDAARACLLGVEAMRDGRISGFHALNIVADDSLSDKPLSELLDRFHPETRQMPGLGDIRTAYTTDRAKRLIGFTAQMPR